MHEPRLIAHDTGNEKSASLANRIWELFGFGTQYAWILCIVYGTCVFKSTESVAWITRTKLAFVIGFAGAYLVLYLLRKQAASGLQNRSVVISAGAAGTLGTALIAFPAGEPNPIVIAVAAILSGISSAILMAGGNKVWSELRSERVMMHLATSALVAGLLYFALLLMPAAVSAAFICLLPITGSFILSSTKKNKPRPGSFRHVDPMKKRAVARVLAFVSSFSFTMGAMLGTMGAADGMSDLLFVSSVAMVGVPCASAFAFFCAARLAPSTMLTYLDRLGAPLMIVGCIVVLTVPPKFVSVGFACIIAGFTLSDLFMWFLNAEMVSRSGRSSLDVLTRSCFVQWTALACGLLVAELVAGVSVSSNPESTRWLFGGCAVILMAVGTFVFTSVDAVRIIEAHEGARAEERLAGACAVIAEQHGLSQRESEVMLFLANGRTVPYIQERLTLSQSTVKTHVRNIYRKLDIDGKQTLIDLAENVADRHT